MDKFIQKPQEIVDYDVLQDYYQKTAENIEYVLFLNVDYFDNFLQICRPIPQKLQNLQLSKAMPPPPLYSMEAGAAIMHTILIYITKYYNM